ncbi:MAG: 4-hydroxybutyrate dehydrogenase [Hungatella hathewayi]|uniref:Uncharacterized protein n=1 Tax=Hungatella hathewayi WAL-18680 TaxID=742737 RepID=G5INF7_9FIRM|nr:4-hydroxybutyrate dehydrogenase [Hungatella hathewayi]EHI57128.1 hypothetical protein HMPREF9473_05035 [ [Hungatella hathewayi WAL-18680]MBS4983927.1 4-hydroxybutyrate dehydrogenase [Hungatella hathewayi]
MQELMVRPTVYRFQQCVEFAGQFQIGKGDLILTNEFIYQPFFASLNLDCDVIYQERYGAGEPTDVMAEAIAGDMNPQCRRIIAIGGGTILDIAKILALDTILPIEELYDGKRPITRSRELILVPTTCGTGSEMTNIAILALTRRNTKKGLAHDSMYADAAVLIPELLKHLPFRFFATSSIDALIHAMESSLSPRSNETLRLFSYRAISMILNGYQEIAARGADARLEHLEEFLLASTYAGIAFGNAGCGAVHAMSYPLGAVCHVPHGEANYAMLTGVMEKYMELKSDGQIQKLNRHMASILGCEEQDIYQELERLLNVLLPRKSLKEYGVTEEELQTFTDSVMTEQGRLMSNTFVPLSRQQVYEIYRRVY